MKLYAANCTHQVQTVNYRLIEGVKGRGYNTQTIGAGRQVQIAGDLNTPQIEAVVRQQTQYGWAGIPDLRPDLFVPIVWSVDKPVPEAVMRDQIAVNSRILKAAGEKLRREAAIATSHGMREFSPNAADTLAVSVEEEKTGTMDHGGDGPMAEGYRMNRDIGIA